MSQLSYFCVFFSLSTHFGFSLRSNQVNESLWYDRQFWTAMQWKASTRHYLNNGDLYVWSTNLQPNLYTVLGLCRFYATKPCILQLITRPIKWRKILLSANFIQFTNYLFIQFLTLEQETYLSLTILLNIAYFFLFRWNFLHQPHPDRLPLWPINF